MSGNTLETLIFDDLDDLDPTETIRVDPDPTAEEPSVTGASSLESSVVLGALLGRGGMAEVREAEQRALGRPVAVKSSKNEDQGVAGRLVQEAQITGALEHPSIVPVHDILVDAAGRPHIVLQRVHGDAWEQLIDDADAVFERFGTQDLLGWNLGVLEAVCNAMHFAHEQGIIHRDLKPDNVMVGGFGQVYVLDWGVAVSVSDGETRFPHARDQRRIAGTPRYMAPEMIVPDGQIGRHTDIYLLGALLYRILAGVPPHRGMSIREILTNIPLFTVDLPGAPVELVELVEQAMASEPSERVESAEAFRRGLRAFAEHRGAVEMSNQASKTLTELEALLVADDPDRVAIYDRFGACRFGFAGALEVWPENVAAAEGLQSAVLAMATWELDQGDDRAAEILLSVLDAVPGPLAEKLASLRGERLAKMSVIERLARDRDPRTGQRIRLAAIVVFTALWTLGPWVTRGSGPQARFGLSGVWIAVLLVLLVVGGRDWVRSSVNRRTAKIISLALGTQFLLLAGIAVEAIEMRQALSALQAINAGFVAGAAIFIDKRFWIASLVFASLYLAGPALGEWRIFGGSFATLTLGIVAAWIWGPGAFRRP